jgi:hypothetical protein
MADIIVKFNGVPIEPTPFVSQSYQFIDYGVRWGNILQIELDGYLPSVSGTGSINNALLNLFTSGQFGKLEVLEGATPIYSWDTCNIEEINISDSHWFKSQYVPYKVKMHRHHVPSGVLEPTNEYGFIQNEDGTVTLNHKISAKGTKTLSAGALNNAITFVRSLTGRNAFAPVFIPNGSGAMVSLSESINRAECSYSVVEVYKYNTGNFNPYIEWFSSSISDPFDSEYLTLDTSLKLQLSPVSDNLNIIETVSALTGADNIYSRLTDIGIQTGMLMHNRMSIVRESGSNSVDIKHSFVSGYSISDLLGFFDYTVSLSKDNVLPRESWRLDGQFVCNGPLSYKQQRLASWKSVSGSNWKQTFSGLIVNSPVWTSFHNPSTIVSSHSQVEIQENTGLAIFGASYSMIEGSSPSIIVAPHYNIEISPSKWNYNIIPAANIEGHYVIQDLQMSSKGRMTFNVGCETPSPLLATPIISGYLSSLESIYINTGFIVGENINTGLLDSSYNREWLGIDNISSGLLNIKVVGSAMANYTRQTGYRFGY